MKTSKPPMDLAEAIALWPKRRQAILLCTIPAVLACMVTMAVLAVSGKARGLFADFSTNIPITLLSGIGCLLWLSFRRAQFVAWIPAILLFVAQTVVVAIAKPLSEWIYALPSYLYTTGTPVLAIVITRKVASQIRFSR